jgi:Fur family ferric uptake transcriptional regulator
MTEDHELRMTESRRAILSALECTRSHPTADEVYEMVRERIPRISLGTVYRNLDLLAREGMVTVLSEAGEQRRYDVAGVRHHHVRCEVCGRLDDVILDDPDAVERVLKDAGGYEIHGYSLCFVGTCSRCCAERSTRAGTAAVEERNTVKSPEEGSSSQSDKEE